MPSPIVSGVIKIIDVIFDGRLLDHREATFVPLGMKASAKEYSDDQGQGYLVKDWHHISKIKLRKHILLSSVITDRLFEDVIDVVKSMTLKLSSDYA